MQRTRIKICGITRPEDAMMACAAGADALGLVFAQTSPRCVEIAQARAIIAAVPPYVTVVGLFMHAPRAEIAHIVGQVALGALQFHGDETPDDCRGFGVPYIKAVAMAGLADPQAYVARFADAQGFLFDSHAPGQRGGLGQTFDWNCLPQGLARPLILAGGLNPANVAVAMRQVRPYAVDVSSGVEAAKGIKDPAKVRDFIRAVHEVDSEFA
ncbi:MAG: phosphoribosylanthranilate isomerase [Pseudomonadota bacterium]